MSNNMIPLRNAQGQNFALLFEPENRLHGWVFYDNHGQWVTLRKALQHEMETAEKILEFKRTQEQPPAPMAGLHINQGSMETSLEPKSRRVRIEEVK